jgi:hypothetical protein
METSTMSGKSSESKVPDAQTVIRNSRVTQRFTHTRVPVKQATGEPSRAFDRTPPKRGLARKF